jgi:putative transposase
MIRAHVIKLDPTHDQKIFFNRCVDDARFAWNWALEEWRKQYAEDLKPNEYTLQKQINACKREKLPFLLETPKTVVQQAIKNLGTAYQNFFNSIKGKRSGPKMSPPDFKKKNRAKKTARLDNGPGTFRFDGKSVKLPKIGWIKTFEELRFDGRPMSATLSFQGGFWWLSVQVELPDVEKTINPKSSIGIDLGLTTAITLSNGEKYEAPKPLKENIKKLRSFNKNLSRKKKGSQNSKKAAKKLSRLHWKIGQIRKDWQHKMTTSIAKRFSLVCVEDLNVGGMMKNRKLSRSISDIGWGEIGVQLKYKCDHVQEIGRFFSSSKLCNKCGEKNDEMSLSTRKWTCAKCGSVHDRDENAAKNIEAEGLRLYTVSYTGINACEDESSGIQRKKNTKLSSVKQESHLPLSA